MLWGIDRELVKQGRADEAVESILRRMDVADNAIPKVKKELLGAVKEGIPDGVVRATESIRNELNTLRDTANIVRKEMGKPQIGFVDDYGPLLQRQSFWNRMQTDAKTTITDNFDFIIPNAKKNPHAIAREGGIESVETNALETLATYIDNVSNDIFISPQIEKLKVVGQVLRDRGYNRTSQFINDVIRQNIVGQPGFIANLLGLKRGAKRTAVINKIIQARSISALSGNVVWTLFVQPASVATLTIPRAGGIAGMKNYASGLIDFVTNLSLIHI